MEWIITEADCPTLVREFLRRRKGLSSTLLARLKRTEGGILLNGRPVTVRAPLSPGDRLSVSDLNADRESAVIPVPLPYGILYEDEALLGLNKPPHMPTHPSYRHPDDSLANAVAWTAKSSGQPFVFRPVSRLDLDTSGLVLCAKTQYAASRLSQSMQAGGIEKTYLSILDGILPAPEGSFESFIQRAEDSIIYRNSFPAETPGADYALTTWKVLAEENGKTLVAASPVTGRTHQLRVHFAALGAPVLGDSLYGHGSPLISRQALHAAKLRFPHPLTGRILSLQAPFPDDIPDSGRALFTDFDIICKDFFDGEPTADNDR
ncbi:MAG: RluA family pseudouridine synthase [Clostridia bacterium]|nr:RluA family pseudouridine synthase [Clostridia bacterium]